MCIRDSDEPAALLVPGDGGDAPRGVAVEPQAGARAEAVLCLLYTSDAADERSSVDLGGRRIIKKKTTSQQRATRTIDRIIITQTPATASTQEMSE